MPFQLSIQAALDAQKTALDTTINAARDNVKADNVTQVNNQTTAINNNVNTKTGDVTTSVTGAVNAKGAVKSVQRGSVNVPGPTAVNVALATIDPAKSFITLVGSSNNTYGLSTNAKITSATNLQLLTPNGNGGVMCWEVVELF